jgi:membrane associated rhomboid family serine protease
MALSDEERARLEKLEQELAASDPDLYRKLQSGVPSSRTSSQRVYGILTTLAGLAVVITGIFTEITIIGALGFVLTMAGAYWFFYGIPKRARTGDPPL